MSPNKRRKDAEMLEVLLNSETGTIMVNGDDSKLQPSVHQSLVLFLGDKPEDSIKPDPL